MNRIALALLGGALAAVDASAATALKVALQVDANSPVTITDSDDPNTGDLNPADRVIDFSTTVDGILAVDGQVRQDNEPIFRTLVLASRVTGGNAVFRNLDPNVPHSVTVTVDSDVFTAPGPPLGWKVGADGSADDVSGGDVEITPDDVQGFVDPNGDPNGFEPLSPPALASAPITPPLPASAQPVAFSAGQRGVATTADAVHIRLVWAFTPGPNDEVRLPDSTSGGVRFAVFNAQDFCVVKMNKRATRVAQVAVKQDVRCLRAGGDQTACVDNPANPKVVQVSQKLLQFFADVCTIPPAFGTNMGTCCDGGTNVGAACAGAGDCPGGACTAGACISGAAANAVKAVVHDMFGSNVNASDGCQSRTLSAAGKDVFARWKTFTDCKRQHISTLTMETDFVSTCLGPPQPDPGRIAKAEGKLLKPLGHCTIPLPAAFPGSCASETSAPPMATCIADRVACRFCRAAIVADDIETPLDCDVFDDGVSNGSCPGSPSGAFLD
jgi:hypothetical protein